MSVAVLLVAITAAVACGSVQAASYSYSFMNGPPNGFSSMHLYFETDKATLPANVSKVYGASQYTYNGTSGSITGVLGAFSAYDNDNVISTVDYPVFSLSGTVFTTSTTGILYIARTQNNVPPLYITTDGMTFTELLANNTQAAPRLTTISVPSSPPLSPPPRPPPPPALPPRPPPHPPPWPPQPLLKYYWQIRRGPCDSWTSFDIYMTLQPLQGGAAFPAAVVAVDSSRSRMVFGGVSYDITGVVPGLPNTLDLGSYPYFYSDHVLFSDDPRLSLATTCDTCYNGSVGPLVLQLGENDAPFGVTDGVNRVFYDPPQVNLTPQAQPPPPSPHPPRPRPPAPPPSQKPPLPRPPSPRPPAAV